ncbi:MAG: hypothetical protein MJZ70_06190 [Bacteroidales bacterium]|nr:hypothetical protein [Bacteroidales bacterium]
MSEEHIYETQREEVAEATAQRDFTVGFLKGNSLTPQKNVVIPPYAVETLVENHVPVRVERRLGKGADFIDLDYADAGALIDDDPQFVWRKADILVCLRPLTIDELAQLKDNQILISPMTMADVTVDHLMVLQIKQITALSLRFIQNVEGGELLQDIIHAEGGPYVASNALGDLVLSLIFPIIFNSGLRYAVSANPALIQAIYCYRGYLVHPEIAEQCGLPCADLLEML